MPIYSAVVYTHSEFHHLGQTNKINIISIALPLKETVVFENTFHQDSFRKWTPQTVQSLTGPALSIYRIVEQTCSLEGSQ